MSRRYPFPDSSGEIFPPSIWDYGRHWNLHNQSVMYCELPSTMFCKAKSAILDHFPTKMFNSETSSFHYFSPRIPNPFDFGKWGQNRPQNLLHEKGQTDTQTDGHRDSMKESAKGRFFEKVQNKNLYYPTTSNKATWFFFGNFGLYCSWSMSSEAFVVNIGQTILWEISKSVQWFAKGWS